MKLNKKILYLMLLVLIIFVPLGLIAQNPAWGEWEPEYFKKTLGFIPKGIEKMSEINFVKPLLPDYSMLNTNAIAGYYISAIVGVGLIFLIFYLLAKFNRVKK